MIYIETDGGQKAMQTDEPTDERSITRKDEQTDIQFDGQIKNDGQYD